MTEWAALSAREREQARERYRSLRAIPPERREILRDKWEQYQSLTPKKSGESAPAARVVQNSAPLLSHCAGSDD